MSAASGEGPSFRVAVVGASSLAGRELRAVLRERHFPISRLVELGAGKISDPEIPVVELDAEVPEIEFEAEAVRGDELDFAFVVSRPDPLPAILRPEFAVPPVVIDLERCLAESIGAVPRIAGQHGAAALGPGSTVIAAAHPATIAITILLDRLARRLELKSAVATVLCPASQLGSRAVEELQRQTVDLLSFKKVPRAVFGEQLAFNVLPRLGGTASKALAGLEERVREELRLSLAAIGVLPAVKLIQTPVFHSMAIALYVESSAPMSPEAVEESLAGPRVKLRRSAASAPSPLSATGTSEIIVDSVVSDSGHANGVWAWAAFDDLRLAAMNAVEIAEQCVAKSRTSSSRRPSL